MTATELRGFYSRIMRRLLWLNGLWLLFVAVMLFLWTPAGIVLVIITVLKYAYDYFDMESQDIYTAFMELTFRKQAEENKSDEETRS